MDYFRDTLTDIQLPTSTNYDVLAAFAEEVGYGGAFYMLWGFFWIHLTYPNYPLCPGEGWLRKLYVHAAADEVGQPVEWRPPRHDCGRRQAWWSIRFRFGLQ